MKRPKPKRHAECDHCHRDKPLLMPVGGAPGWPVIVWQLLCLDCRLNESHQPSRHWTPAEWMRFHHRPEVRAAYDNWLAADFKTMIGPQ